LEDISIRDSAIAWLIGSYVALASMETDPTVSDLDREAADAAIHLLWECMIDFGIDLECPEIVALIAQARARARADPHPPVRVVAASIGSAVREQRYLLVDASDMKWYR
jgi:hypothetical protein